MLDRAKNEFVAGRMSLGEFEAVVENYLAGGEYCLSCGRFPVNDDFLCERHRA